MRKQQHGLGCIYISPVRERMALTTLGQASIKEVGKLHRYAAHQLAVTLAFIQNISQAGGCASAIAPLQEVALHHLKREYIRNLLTLVNQMGITLIEELGQGHLPSWSQAERQRRIDQIAQWYVQRVRMILWR